MKQKTLFSLIQLTDMLSVKADCHIYYFRSLEGPQGVLFIVSMYKERDRNCPKFSATCFDMGVDFLCIHQSFSICNTWDFGMWGLPGCQSVQLVNIHVGIHFLNVPRLEMDFIALLGWHWHRHVFSHLLSLIYMGNMRILVSNFQVCEPIKYLWNKEELPQQW
jgi:hypothetical protein